MMSEITFDELLKILDRREISHKPEIGVVLRGKPDYAFGTIKIDFSIDFLNKHRIAVLKAINEVLPICSLSTHQHFDIKEEE